MGNRRLICSSTDLHQRCVEIALAWRQRTRRSSTASIACGVNDGIPARCDSLVHSISRGAVTIVDEKRLAQASLATQKGPQTRPERIRQNVATRMFLTRATVNLMVSRAVLRTALRFSRCPQRGQLFLNLRLHPTIHRLIEPLRFHVVREVGFACGKAAFFVVGVAVAVAVA